MALPEGGEQAHFTQQIAEQTLRQLQRATTGVSELQERVESLEQRFRYDGRLSDELFTPPLYEVP